MDDDAIDRLAAATVIEDYGDISIVTIPGVENLTDRERSAVLGKARMQPDPRLLERLQFMTPPIDEDEALEEAHATEAHAREELESAGCPPCYPVGFNPWDDDMPKEYHPIVGCWKALAGTDRFVLSAQLRDWQKFRTHQKNVRARHGSHGFGRYVDEVGERRRRFELSDGVTLLHNQEQQSQREDWMEYQDYLIRLWLSLDKRRQDTAMKLQALDRVGHQSHITNIAAILRPGDHYHDVSDADILQARLAYRASKVEQQGILLQWAEQQRSNMSPDVQTPADCRQSGYNGRWRTVRQVSESLSAPHEPKMTSKRSRTQGPCCPSDESGSHMRRKDGVQDTSRRRTAKASSRVNAQPKRSLRIANLYDKPAGATVKPASSAKRAIISAKHSRSPRVAAVLVRTRSGRVSKPPVRWTS